MKKQLKLRKFKVANLSVSKNIRGGGETDDHYTYNCHSHDCGEALKTHEQSCGTVNDTVDSPNCIKNSQIIVH